MGDQFSGAGCSCNQAACGDAECRAWAKVAKKQAKAVKKKDATCCKGTKSIVVVGTFGILKCIKKRGHTGKHEDAQGFYWT